jgi:hypothetical protein
MRENAQEAVLQVNSGSWNCWPLLFLPPHLDSISLSAPPATPQPALLLRPQRAISLSLSLYLCLSFFRFAALFSARGNASTGTHSRAREDITCILFAYFISERDTMSVCVHTGTHMSTCDELV